jgi:excisionase family DNA binding protein
METYPAASAQFHADSDPWLTLREGAKHVRANEVTLRREIQRNRLRHARIGGRKSIRLRRSWLDAWLEKSTTPTEMNQAKLERHNP